MHLLGREARLGVPRSALRSTLQSVDGTGSGLDADTLRGLTPEQLTQQAIAGAMHYIVNNDYTRDAQAAVAVGTCACVEVVCDDGSDFRVNCSGAFMPLAGFQGDLTAVGATPGTFNSCGACGCNVTDSPATLAASVVCIAAP